MGCNCKKVNSLSSGSSSKTVIKHSNPSSNGRLKGKLIRRIIK